MFRSCIFITLLRRQQQLEVGVARVLEPPALVVAEPEVFEVPRIDVAQGVDVYLLPLEDGQVMTEAHRLEKAFDWIRNLRQVPKWHWLRGQLSGPQVPEFPLPRRESSVAVGHRSERGAVLCA